MRINSAVATRYRHDTHTRIVYTFSATLQISTHKEKNTIQTHSVVRVTILKYFINMCINPCVSKKNSCDPHIWVTLVFIW